MSSTLSIGLVELEIKKARSDTARAVGLLNRGFFVYFVFILFAVMGFINNLIDGNMLNIFITLGIISLFVAVIPYFRMFNASQRKIEGFINDIEK